jgi:hypothetical protein
VNASKLVGALAKAAVATLVNGPIAGGTTAANEAVDLLVAWLGREWTPALQTTIADVSRGLEDLARSERVAADHVELGLAQARATLLSHGLSTAEMVSLDLSAERVTTTVFSRSSLDLALLDEPAREVCRRAIRTIYMTVLSKPESLPEFQRAFQAAILTRLTELRDQPQEILRSIRGALAAAAIADRRHRWRPDVYPPSALVRAEFEIVPFYGRTDVLDDLRTWAGADRQVAVRVYTGAGGMGKTRLMTEFCRRLADEGWRAGFLNRAAGGRDWLVALDPLFERDRLLLVIDYAETRQRDVVASLDRAVAGTASGRVRIVLLARSLGDWWLHLTALDGRVGEILNGPATNLVSLRPLAPDPTERHRLFEQAASAFQRVVPGAHTPTQPSLEARHYDRALYVLITALAAVQGDLVETESDLLDWALRRERQFLDDGVSSLAGGQLKGRPILQCAAVATLAGRTNDRAEAARLLSSSAPLLDGQPAAVVDAVAELLHRLYPGETWLEGVQPDLLGEHLVEWASEDDPDLLGAVFGHP